MGCFFACFGSINGKKRRRPTKKMFHRNPSRRNYQPLPSISPLKEMAAETAIMLPPDSRDKTQDLSIKSRKKVTFDLNVKIYDETPSHEAPAYTSENDDDRERENEKKKAKKRTKLNSPTEDSSITSITRTGFYPSNHRYQKCICSDSDVEEEEDEEEWEDSDFEDDDSEEESFNSYFSRSLLAPKAVDLSGEPRFSPDRKSTALVGKNIRDRSQYIHSVLNPVENLTQWKSLKAKTSTPLMQHQKENIDLQKELHVPFLPMPAFKLPKPQIPIDGNTSFKLPKSPKQEISVTTSLSTWLVPHETILSTKASFNQIESMRNLEDRPISGDIAEEELKQSAFRSTNQSSDEIVILGTFGSHRNYINQAVNCKGMPNAISI